MSYRRFTDSEGHTWEAWEVLPTVIERRVSADRRAAPRTTPDRRVQRDFRLVIPRELQQGWLAVRGEQAKVRLAPIPDGWLALSDQALAMLVRQAAHTTEHEH